MIRRRILALLRTTIVAGIAWTIVGLVVGAIVQLQVGAGDQGVVVFGRSVPGGFMAAFAIVGAFVGIVNGLTFSFLLIASERGKRVEQIRGWRFAAWGTVATGVPIGLLLQSPIIAAVGGAIGGAGALAALWSARRAQVHPEVLPSHQRERLTD